MKSANLRCISMSESQELPKAYDASAVEDSIYAAWESSGMFNPDQLPDRNQQGEPFCIMMPPPNRTGTLHMGHAQRMTIQDLMIRFERMRGKKALWIPGTDHAAIATQVKVEQLLIKEGYKDPRKELGREAFLKRVVEFADQSRDIIVKQARKMGSSCDWSRERYTLDAERNLAVNTLFGMMYEDGLIERGYRVVNWDPQFKTTLSDDEVETKEVTARLLTFKYAKDFPIAISSTRAETKFGDTAVAVHPDDERYQSFIGQTFEPEFCGKKLSIRVIADASVDPTFGTGALGVTPAHSMIDAEIAERHQLPTIQVIDQEGKMMADCGPEYVGKTTIEARAIIEQKLDASGLLIKIEEVAQALPIAQRGGATVEQLPSRQWFVRVNKKFALRQPTLGKWNAGEEVTLKELMLYAVESGQITILPDRFEKVYFHWINHLRDWCISRQIWFGHQIPVWYRKVAASEGAQEEEVKYSVDAPGEDWERDPDTLDTWFSSGAWTFSALGWPKGEEWNMHRAYHPTAVLETGRDILFFWVARMVLMSTYAIGEVPFKTVYLSGLINDEQGRKMSKSLGNILDPLELIPKYGTDAVRLSIIIGTAPGQDSRLSEQKIEGYRNFTNKLWNISRFILMQLQDDRQKTSATKTLADDWILSRLADVSASVTSKIEQFHFSAAGEELRDFTWNDLADWYLEIAKVEGGKADILKTVQNAMLRLWHPYMPFVTEHVWKLMGAEGHLMVASWPEYVNDSLGRASEFEKLRMLVTDIRRLRAEQGVEPIKKLSFGLVADEAMMSLVGDNLEWIKRLTNAASIEVINEMPNNWVVATSGSSTIGFDKTEGVDLEAERTRLQKELKGLEQYITATEAKLGDAEFSKKAPEHVVKNMSDKLEEAKEKAKVIMTRLQ